jgi:hypothetical protein
MRLLITFTGETERCKNGYTNAVENYQNWKKTIFDDLESNGISYDVAFITYKDPPKILDEITKLVKPAYIIFFDDSPYLALKTMQKVSDFLKTKDQMYDRYLVFRFDMVFKIKITTWPMWEKKGIILDWKEKHWYIDQVYGSLIYIFDKECLKYYHECVAFPKHNKTPHHIGQYLYHNNIPFYCMYDECYYNTNNPICSLRPIEDEPDLDNPKKGIPIPYIGKHEEYVLDSLIRNTPVIFAKYGDGEYLASIGHGGANCDGIPYTQKLRNGITQSYKYLSQLPNCIIGKWHYQNVTSYWESIASPKWCKYHLFHLEKEDIKDVKENKANKKLDLFKTIKESSSKKILISNKLLTKACLLLNIDTHITVDAHNWFELSFEKIYEETLEKLLQLDPNKSVMILFACGIGGKILIEHLHKKFPDISYLDIGSSIDFICTKKDSRGREISYEDMLLFFNNLITDKEEWNNPKYENLYIESQKELGIHL